MIAVGRHIGGITLNDLEYLLDENGDIMQFESESKAKEYLKDQGLTEDEIYWLVFEEVET